MKQMKTKGRTTTKNEFHWVVVVR